MRRSADGGVISNGTCNGDDLRSLEFIPSLAANYKVHHHHHHRHFHPIPLSIMRPLNSRAIASSLLVSDCIYRARLSCLVARSMLIVFNWLHDGGCVQITIMGLANGSTLLLKREKNAALDSYIDGGGLLRCEAFNNVASSTSRE